ncbi:hypothetical protein RJ641_012038 [Dillenia turbinata]|uniref:Uncharacterized protein n=1 Tax=Dillenia turbinata TaxID=194707 RepID=A0AAN8V0P4_9MAGN
MGTRVPVQHQQYNLRSAAAVANSYMGVGTSLHDLNSVDITRPPDDSDIDNIPDVDRDAVTVTDDDDDESSAVVSDCMHEPYSSSLPLHGVGGVEDDRSSIENTGSSRDHFDVLTLDGDLPI